MDFYQIAIDYLDALLGISLEMAPYLLLGFFIAGLLHVYLPVGTFHQWFGKKNLKSVVMASLMGIPLPLCSCGVIPTGISLYKDGASKGSTLSFLISTPQTGVDSIMVTYSLLGLPFAIMRPIIALVTGVFGGWVENSTNTDEADHAHRKEFGKTNGETAVQKKSMNQVFKYAFGEFMEDIADWLLIGILLAAFIQVIIPESFFESVFMKNELLSMGIILVASIPFYVCATGSVPIAAVLLLKGLNPGAVLVFLMAGPATNIATMTVINKSLGRKTLLVYLGALVLGSMIFGWLINRMPANLFDVSDMVMEHHQDTWMWWIKLISAIFLAIFTFRILLLKMRNWFRKKEGLRAESKDEMVIEVQGMTCDGCKSKVESTLISLDEINESNADLETQQVVLKGNNMNAEQIQKSVESSGYKFIKVVSNAS